MDTLTEKQKRQLAILAELADGGDLTVMHKFLEMQDSLEVTSEEIAQMRDEVKNIQAALSKEVQVVAEMKQKVPEKGDTYVLTDTDRRQIADSITVPIVEKITERIETIKEQPIVTEITKITSEIKEVAVTDTPDQVVEKVNSSSLLIKKERIEGLLDLMMNAAANAVASVGITTTNFFKNGTLVGRAKNINLIEGSNVTLGVQMQGDQANVTITGVAEGSFSVLVPIGALNQGVFVFTSAPSVIVLDNGNMMNKVSSDGTVNWTGTTTVTLTQFPNFNIYGF